MELDYGNLMKLKYDGTWLTYKELCECLNIPYLTSNSKKRQMKELESICVIEKNKTKYKIIDIVSKEEMLLFNNRSVYLPYIELILLNKFYTTKKDILFLSTKEIVYLCNMINENYKAIAGGDMYFKSMKVSKANNFNFDNFYKYMDKSYNNVLQPIIATALHSMDRRKTISLNKGFKVYKMIDEDLSVMNYRYTTDNDMIGKEMFKIEGEIFNEMGIKNVGELYGKKKNLIKTYHYNCNDRVKYKSKNDKFWLKNKWDFDGFYRCHAIVLNLERIKFVSMQLKDELNIRIQKRLLETKTLDFLTGDDRKEFILATIDKAGENKYDFEKDIKNTKLVLDDLIKL